MYYANILWGNKNPLFFSGVFMGLENRLTVLFIGGLIVAMIELTCLVAFHLIFGSIIF
jgi:hypothetical protein